MTLGTFRNAASIAAALALVLGCMPAFGGARAVAQVLTHDERAMDVREYR